MTAAAATAAHLHTEYPGARVLLLNSGDVTDDLGPVDLVDESATPNEVDVVVLGGAGPEFTYSELNRVFQCVMAGAALVAMHRSAVWRTSEGLQLDTGAYLSALEAAAQVEAAVIGKPAPAMFTAGLESMGAKASEAAMVGDDINTDVRAAQAMGITGVQVRTGKFLSSQLEHGEAPDVLIDSFAELPEWLGL
jgi:HAD superfamily hydrolase (TIGR01458 family)